MLHLLEDRILLHFVLVSLFILDLIHISQAYIAECSQQLEYRHKCNRCWCLPNKTFICTKMICNMIPKKFWKQAKIVSRQRAFAIAVFAFLTITKIVKLITASAKLYSTARGNKHINPPKRVFAKTKENECL